MGKLVEKLEQIGQAGGGGLGFARARTPSQKPRPAAVLVALSSSDGASAEAAAESGVDAVIISGWQSSTNISAITTALASTKTLWGVEIAAEGPEAADALSAAQEAGASFALVGQTTPAQTLLAEVEHFDTIIALDPPHDEYDLVLLRAQNLLPAQVALLQTPLSNADLARMTVRDFVQLNLVFETLRFPTLIALKEVPETAHVRALVRLGADGIVLTGRGLTAEDLGAQISALREELEKTPARSQDRSGVAIGSLMEQAGRSLAQPAKEPEKDPEKE